MISSYCSLDFYECSLQPSWNLRIIIPAFASVQNSENNLLIYQNGFSLVNFKLNSLHVLLFEYLNLDQTVLYTYLVSNFTYQPSQPTEQQNN